MKRAPIVLASTVAGMAVTLGFHAHPPSVSPAAGTGVAAAATKKPGPGTGTGTTTSRASSSTAKAAAPPVSRSVTSAVESNQYGNVQLKVALKAGRISAVQAVQLPQSDGKSVQINAYAEPVLQQSALRVQSAHVDAVSGATYTTDSYRLALQSALDKAGFTAGSSRTS